jgi:hypothetical protein
LLSGSNPKTESLTRHPQRYSAELQPPNKIVQKTEEGAVGSNVSRVHCLPTLLSKGSRVHCLPTLLSVHIGVLYVIDLPLPSPSPCFPSITSAWILSLPSPSLSLSVCVCPSHHPSLYLVFYMYSSSKAVDTCVSAHLVHP